MVAAVIAVTVVAVAALAGVAYLGYAYGSRFVAYEQAMKQIYVKAHTDVSAKLAAVKAEVEKIEAEAKAEEQAVVARLKKLF